jgi:Cytochrome c7 and related cytochrome c
LNAYVKGMKSYRNTLLLVVVIAAFLMLLFLINQETRSGQYEPTVSKSKKIEDMNADMNTDIKQGPSNYTFLAAKDVCEGCHMSGKRSIPQALTVSPHKNGGAYCLSCHVISHQEHPMKDKGVMCENCHGNTRNPVTPVYSNGSIPCNNCHNYPDALSPSGGNLITIHRSRGITCNKCHTDDCRKCHTELGSNARWGKRLDHFEVLAKRNS